MFIIKNIYFKKKYNFFLKKRNNFLNFYNKINFFDYIFFFENEFLKIYKSNINYFKDLYFRVLADLENFKKKSNNEILKCYKYSLEEFSEDLLPVVDALESTLNGNFKNVEDVLEGVRLTLKIFLNSFNKKGINHILPNKGDLFDPHKHLAVSLVSLLDKKDNIIINILQKGYNISERVLRPALVVVNKV